MLETTDTSRQLDRLGNAIKAYRLASGQSMVFSMIHAGHQLAHALHAETKKISPIQSEIEGVPAKVGWLSKPRAKSLGTERSHKVRTSIIHYGGINKMIAARILHRGYQAAGWVPAIKGFAVTNNVVTVERKLGAVLAHVEKETGRVHITLINRAINIVAQTQKHDILKKSIDRLFRSFSPYIKSHLNEEARKAFWKL